VGALSGAAAGALIGLLHKTERWCLANPPVLVESADRAVSGYSFE